MVKLTLSATPETVRLAKLLAQRRHTTVSALFARFIAVNAALEGDSPNELEKLRDTPLCRQALEIGRRGGSVGEELGEMAVLEEELCKKYLGEKQ